MKRLKVFMFLVVSVFFFCGQSYAIGPGDIQDLLTLTPTDLANSLVGAGNVAPPGAIYNGSEIAAGTFINGLADGLGIDQGVILTTGDVLNAVGPNLYEDVGLDNALLGDLALDALIPPRDTYDVTGLEFNFIAPPDTVTLTFSYVFASEEYPESVGTDFDDVFGLFVNGVNIALVPGTTNPISINTLNGIATPALYDDNSNLLVPPFGTQYDGFSSVLKATLSVTPGNSYHIKMAIADGSPVSPPDATYDSAVFISGSVGNTDTMVANYYNTILGRAPDPAGEAFWNAEIQRIAALGIDIKEGFQGLAKLFFDSEEYANKNKNDDDFVEDLYLSFLNRASDPGGKAFWADQLAQGLTRDMLVIQFANSAEFIALLAGIYGDLGTDPEKNLVNDFYRGLLNRLPDSQGCNDWAKQVKDAQCVGPQAVRDVSRQIASLFAHSEEYSLRGRNNSGYVEDLYNAFLRRGADPAGFLNWLDTLDTGTMTRDQVLEAFVNSPEFQLRVEEVVNTGKCNP